MHITHMLIFFDNLTDLDKIDWPLLQRRDFKRDPDDPAKFERYQAEALIHQHCPVSGLLGMVCFTEDLKADLEHQISERDLILNVHARREWYFQ